MTLPATGYRIQATGYRIPATGYRIQATGYRLPDTGCRIQDAGYRLPDTGYRIQATGYRLPDTGYRIQDAGLKKADQHRQKLMSAHRRNQFSDCGNLLFSQLEVIMTIAIAVFDETRHDTNSTKKVCGLWVSRMTFFGDKRMRYARKITAAAGRSATPTAQPKPQPRPQPRRNPQARPEGLPLVEVAIDEEVPPAVRRLQADRDSKAWTAAIARGNIPHEAESRRVTASLISDDEILFPIVRNVPVSAVKESPAFQQWQIDRVLSGESKNNRIPGMQTQLARLRSDYQSARERGDTAAMTAIQNRGQQLRAAMQQEAERSARNLLSERSAIARGLAAPQTLEDYLIHKANQGTSPARMVTDPRTGKSYRAAETVDEVLESVYRSDHDWSNTGVRDRYDPGRVDTAFETDNAQLNAAKEQLADNYVRRMFASTPEGQQAIKRAEAAADAALTRSFLEQGTIGNRTDAFDTDSQLTENDLNRWELQPMTQQPTAIAGLYSRPVSSAEARAALLQSNPSLRLGEPRRQAEQLQQQRLYFHAPDQAQFGSKRSPYIAQSGEKIFYKTEVVPNPELQKETGTTPLFMSLRDQIAVRQAAAQNRPSAVQLVNAERRIDPVTGSTILVAKATPDPIPYELQGLTVKGFRDARQSIAPISHSTANQGVTRISTERPFNEAEWMRSATDIGIPVTSALSKDEIEAIAEISASKQPRVPLQTSILTEQPGIQAYMLSRFLPPPAARSPYSMTVPRRGENPLFDRFMARRGYDQPVEYVREVTPVPNWALELNKDIPISPSALPKSSLPSRDKHGFVRRDMVEPVSYEGGVPVSTIFLGNEDKQPIIFPTLGRDVNNIDYDTRRRYAEEGLAVQAAAAEAERRYDRALEAIRRQTVFDRREQGPTPGGPAVLEDGSTNILTPGTRIERAEKAAADALDSLIIAERRLRGDDFDVVTPYKKIADTPFGEQAKIGVQAENDTSAVSLTESLPGKIAAAQVRYGGRNPYAIVDAPLVEPPETLMDAANQLAAQTMLDNINAQRRVRGMMPIASLEELRLRKDELALEDQARLQRIMSTPAYQAAVDKANSKALTNAIRVNMTGQAAPPSSTRLRAAGAGSIGVSPVPYVVTPRQTSGVDIRRLGGPEAGIPFPQMTQAQIDAMNAAMREYGTGGFDFLDF